MLGLHQPPQLHAYSRHLKSNHPSLIKTAITPFPLLFWPLVHSQQPRPLRIHPYVHVEQ